MPKRTQKNTKKNKKTPNKKRPIKHRKTAKQHKRRKSYKQRGGDGDIPRNTQNMLHRTNPQQPPQPQPRQSQPQPRPQQPRPQPQPRPQQPPPSNEFLPLNRVLDRDTLAAYGFPVAPLANSPSRP